MNFAAEKTKAILITRKRNYDRPKLKLCQEEVMFTDRLKVLGITLDNRLNFLYHLDDIHSKACKIYKLVSRAARAQWGLNSDIIRIIYTAVIEPTVLYGSSIWATITKKKYAERRLDRITRQFAIMISKSHRTASLVSCTLLARILPLTLRAQEQLQLYEIRRGKSHPQLPGKPLQKNVSPYSLPHPRKRKRILYKMIESVSAVRELHNEYMAVYTDGSKLNGKVGGAVSFWFGGVEKFYTSFRMEDYCSVFQAELFAIWQALEVINADATYKNVYILSDALSALESVSNPECLHPLVANIRSKLQELDRKEVTVELYWVKAHIGIHGNERADELAKGAALNNLLPSVYDAFPLSYAKHLIRNSSILAWQKRYQEATTGAVTKKFFPSVSEAYMTLSYIKLNNLRAQLFTGHGGFRSYLYRFKLNRSPFCICDNESEETVEHVVAECPRFTAKRADLEIEIGLAINISNFNKAINDNHCRGPFLAFAEAVVRIAARANGSTV